MASRRMIIDAITCWHLCFTQIKLEVNVVIRAKGFWIFKKEDSFTCPERSCENARGRRGTKKHYAFPKIKQKSELWTKKENNKLPVKITKKNCLVAPGRSLSLLAGTPHIPHSTCRLKIRHVAPGRSWSLLVAPGRCMCLDRGLGGTLWVGPCRTSAQVQVPSQALPGSLRLEYTGTGVQIDHTVCTISFRYPLFFWASENQSYLRLRVLFLDTE